MSEPKAEDESSPPRRTAQALRRRQGGVPREVVQRNQAHNQIRRGIIQALEQGPLTVPEIAAATGFPAHRVLWHLTGLRKYGQLVEGELRGDYYAYALIQEQEEQT